MAKFVPFRAPAHGIGSVELMLAALTSASPASGGMDRAERKKRERVIDAIEEADKKVGVILEDADHETLVAAMKGVRHVQLSRPAMSFVDGVEDDVFEAKKPVTPAAKPATPVAKTKTK